MVLLLAGGGEEDRARPGAVPRDRDTMRSLHP